MNQAYLKRQYFPQKLAGPSFSKASFLCVQYIRRKTIHENYAHGELGARAMFPVYNYTNEFQI